MNSLAGRLLDRQGQGPATGGCGRDTVKDRQVGQAYCDWFFQADQQVPAPGKLRHYHLKR